MNNEVTPSQMSHKELPSKSRPIPPSKPNKSMKRPLRGSSDTSSGEEFDIQTQPFISPESGQSPSGSRSSSDDKNNQSGSRKARIIETSLDDLEVDYELEETIRPVSTFLETNVDVDSETNTNNILPPMRSAQSQYIPSASSRRSPQTGGGSSRAPSDDFKALSARSKSMPLETEM
jgi:hypothetical protein